MGKHPIKISRFYCYSNYPFIATGDLFIFVLILVKMNTVLLTFRYNSETGTFTVPPGGDGYYYFSTYLVVNHIEYGAFDIVINGERLCTAYTEQQVSSEGDPGQAACSGAAYVTEGMYDCFFL